MQQSLDMFTRQYSLPRGKPQGKAHHDKVRVRQGGKRKKVITCPYFYLFPSATTMGGRADQWVANRFPGKKERTASDLPWGSE